MDDPLVTQVKQFIEYHDISQAQASVLLGISQATLSRLLRGSDMSTSTRLTILRRIENGVEAQEVYKGHLHAVIDDASLAQPQVEMLILLISSPSMVNNLMSLVSGLAPQEGTSAW